MYPGLPVSVRVALGVCFYYNGKYHMARLAFERVLQLEPRTARAVFGLAQIYYVRGDYDSYFEHLQKAFQLDQNDPVTLLSLAQHYVIKKDFTRAEKLISRGLERLNYFPKFSNYAKFKASIPRYDQNDLSSRYYYLRGSIFHQQKNYTEAHQNYRKAVDQNKNNFEACYGLSQTIIHQFFENQTVTAGILDRAEPEGLDN